VILEHAPGSADLVVRLHLAIVVFQVYELIVRNDCPWIVRWCEQLETDLHLVQEHGTPLTEKLLLVEAFK